MSVAAVVLNGTVTTEGELRLEGGPALPRGRVRVTIEPEGSVAQEAADLLAVLARIRRMQEERGFRGRPREEIDAQVSAMRDEWEHRQAEVERLQDSCREAGPAGPTGE